MKTSIVLLIVKIEETLQVFLKSMTKPTYSFILERDLNQYHDDDESEVVYGILDKCTANV